MVFGAGSWVENVSLWGSFPYASDHVLRVCCDRNGPESAGQEVLLANSSEKVGGCSGDKLQLWSWAVIRARHLYSTSRRFSSDKNVIFPVLPLHYSFSLWVVLPLKATIVGMFPCRRSPSRSAQEVNGQAKSQTGLLSGQGAVRIWITPDKCLLFYFWGYGSCRALEKWKPTLSMLSFFPPHNFVS